MDLHDGDGHRRPSPCAPSINLCLLQRGSCLEFHIIFSCYKPYFGPPLKSRDGDQSTEWHKDILAICNNTDHSYGKGILSRNNVRIDVQAIKATHKLPPFVIILIYA